MNTICDVRKLTYVIKSIVSNEFILNFDDCESLRIVMDEREDFLFLAKMRFSNLCPKKGLRIYGMPNVSLKEYHADRHSSSVWDNEPI